MRGLHAPRRMRSGGSHTSLPRVRRGVQILSTPMRSTALTICVFGGNSRYARSRVQVARDGRCCGGDGNRTPTWATVQRLLFLNLLPRLRLRLHLHLRVDRQRHLYQHLQRRGRSLPGGPPPRDRWRGTHRLPRSTRERDLLRLVGHGGLEHGKENGARWRSIYGRLVRWTPEVGWLDGWQPHGRVHFVCFCSILLVAHSCRRNWSGSAMLSPHAS